MDELYLSVEASLIKLKLEYIDLLLIHWLNPQVPLDQTIEFMLILKEQGKVAHIGISNFPLSLLKQTREEYLAPIFCNQVEYPPMLGLFDLLDYALEHDLMITAYSSFAQGRLINNLVLEEIGKKYQKSAAQVALKWLLEQEQVVAIQKATTPEHLQANLEAIQFDLNHEDFFVNDDLEKNIRVVNSNFAPDWD